MVEGTWERLGQHLLSSLGVQVLGNFTKTHDGVSPDASLNMTTLIADKAKADTPPARPWLASQNVSSRQFHPGLSTSVWAPGGSSRSRSSP